MMQTDSTSSAISVSTEAPPSLLNGPFGKIPTALWHRITLGIIVVLATFLNIFQLHLNNYGNIYYAATVKSMLQSWHNFWYVSFDPAGFVTVDKPPLGLWIQAASAKIFGFSGLSLLLPQAIAGVISVALLYHLVRRVFGPLAGLLAALALAITPISVMTSRGNNMDTLLVLTLLLAVWALVRATETGKLHLLLLSFFMVALGFNIKTLQAYMVLPAFFLLYLAGSVLRWRTKIWHLAIASVLLLVISFAWITAFDLTPADQRPYAGSSQTNSMLELTLGYNGLSRLLGMGGMNNNPVTMPTNQPSGTPPDGNQPNSTGPRFSEVDFPGPFRLFNVQLGGQIGWLLPLAICGFLALSWQQRIRLPLERSQQQALLWGMWLLTMGVFFSIAGFFHTYYLVMLAPAICALSGAGLVRLWYDYKHNTGWRGWFLPMALLLTTAEQLYLITAYQDWNWLAVLVTTLTLLAALGLIILRLRTRKSGQIEVEKTAQLDQPLHSNVQKRTPFIWQAGAIGIALSALLLTPAIWSVVTLFRPANLMLPTAGPLPPQNVGGFTMDGGLPPLGDNKQRGNNPSSPGRGNMAGPQKITSDEKLINYLVEHQDRTEFLVGTTSSMAAAPIILATGKPVMAMGGFSGRDPILTPESLEAMIKDGSIRYFLVPGGNMPNTGPILIGPAGTEASKKLSNWIIENCSAVPTDRWSSLSKPSNDASNSQPGSGNQTSPLPGGDLLYDCGTIR